MRNNNQNLLTEACMEMQSKILYMGAKLYIILLLTGKKKNKKKTSVRYFYRQKISSWSLNTHFFFIIIISFGKKYLKIFDKTC